MKQISTALIFICTTIQMVSQSFFLNEPNTSAECPVEWLSYSVTNSVSEDCFYHWEVTNGFIQGGFNIGNTATITTSTKTINVSWKDVAEFGNINVESDCVAEINNRSANRNYPILSLNGVNPGAITGPSNILPNSTSNVTFTVTQVNYPVKGTADPTTYQAESYQWEFPTGWGIVSGEHTNSITLLPNECSGGNIRVRGETISCSEGPFYSNWSTTKFVTRTLATPGTISGVSSINCTDTSVKTFSVSAVPGATSYTWTKPSGWTGNSSTNTINLTPDGTTEGNITVTANACGFQSAASSKTISTNPIDPSVSLLISGLTPVCNTGSTFTLSNMPTYATLSWTHSSNLTYVSGQNTTSYTIKANNTSTSGSGWVDATISTPCGDLPPIRADVWVGIPYAFLVTGPTLVDPASYNNYSAEEWNNQPSFSNQGVNSSVIDWSFGLGTTNAGWDCFSCTGKDAYILSGNLSTWVTAKVVNTCGNYIRNYEVFVEQEDCPPGGCDEPFIVYPNPSSEEIMIQRNNPNINLKDVEQEVIIYDSNGSIVYSSREKGQNQIKISASEFKDGIYYLSITENGERKTQQIVISH